MESNLCAYSQLNAENPRHEFTRVNVIAVHKEAKVIYLGMLHAVGCLLNLRKSFPLSRVWLVVCESAEQSDKARP